MDTYNENFIMNNSEKILQRIRMLMKESYFYIKKNLIDAINIPKEYPRTQIFAALTQLIEDNNEFIVDKYGRNGRLINIGDYYLFQPIELKNNNISIFERTVPIDYKHEMINFEIKKNIGKQPIKTKNIAEKEKIINLEGKKIIDEFQKNLEISREYSKKPNPRVERGDDNWYKHCGAVMKKMRKTFNDLSNETLIGFLVSHMIELLMYADKINVMNYLYSLDNVVENSVEEYAKKYFEQNSIITPNFKAIILYNLNKRIILILNENEEWVVAGPEDQREIVNSMSKEDKKELEFDKSKYNKMVGFIGYEKSNKYLVFKTKDIDSARDTGARCDESGKDKAIKKITSILNEDNYNKLVLRPKLDKDGNIIKDKQDKPVEETIGHVELCVLMEFILRYFNSLKREDKKWFLTPEMAIYHKLYKVIV
jgi:hypothetical protein